MNRRIVTGLGLGAFLFAACAGDPDRQGNGSIQPAERLSGLYVASGDESITRIDLRSGIVKEFTLGKEPSRIARIEGRVYITLRNERAVLVLEEDGTDLNQVGRIETGSEPYGIVATDSRVFVAASTAGSVDEYDSVTFAHLRSWRIPGEPRWLALHPSQKTMYVGSTYGGRVSQIDLHNGALSPVSLPEIQGFNFRDGTPLTLAPRVTGDLAVSKDGLYVPMLYVDNETPIRDVDASNIDDPMTEPCRAVDDSAGPKPQPGGGSSERPPPPDGTEPGPQPPAGVPPGGDCGGGYNNQKFNPVVTRVPVDEETGDVVRELAPEAISLVTFLATTDSNGFTIGGEQVNSYPSAATVSPDGKLVFASLEGSDVVLAFPAQLDLQGAPVPNDAILPGEPAGRPGMPGGASFSFRSIAAMRTGAAPRGIALIGSRLFVHAAFDRRVEEFDVAVINRVLDSFTRGGAAKDLLGPDGSPKPIRPVSTRMVSSAVLDPQVEAGRRLFFAANNPVMATVGAGVSCGTCHFDGRTDGITWRFERGLRQTPNLAANLRYALPVGWAGNVPTVAQEGFSTSQRLMGGTGLTPDHTRALEAFLFSARSIDTQFKGSQDSALVRGAALFANKGCISCHNGAAYTDNQVYSMFGLDRVKTRPLAGISASAPYFHDGSAERLEDVVSRAARGEMGQPFSVTPEEVADLVVYLKSL